jgi:hypothetical protein
MDGAWIDEDEVVTVALELGNIDSPTGEEGPREIITATLLDVLRSSRVWYSLILRYVLGAWEEGIRVQRERGGVTRPL